MPNLIKTFSGQLVNSFKLNEKDIDFFDIAHSLSQKCRFNGHCSVSYTVAEHSIWLAHLVPKELQLTALMHDFTEAYLTDIPGPHKPSFYVKINDEMISFEQLEKRIYSIGAKKFGLIDPIPKDVHIIDKYLCEIEMSLLFNNNIHIDPLEQFFVNTWYKSCFDKITNGLDLRDYKENIFIYERIQT